MDVLFKNVKFFAPNSPFHLQSQSLHIQNGKIVTIGKGTSPAETEVDAEGLWVSAGWFDMHAEITDPGFEHKEDSVSVANAAAAGGFTEMLCFANTEPLLQTKNALQSLTQQTKNLPVTFHAVGGATMNGEGKDLTEILDMQAHGAIAFSDGNIGIQQAEVVLKALQYLQISDGLLINRAEHLKLNDRGQMHEGLVSTRLGLKGMPALAEELHLTRDLELLAFNGGKLHVPFISSAKSVEKIREAKAKGMQVTCGVATYQLAFTDEQIIPFDTNYKVNPPLRSAADRKALIEGLLDGTIDVLVSGHKPEDVENKKLEFDHAAFGMINLETAFSVARTFARELPLEVILEKIITNPRKILNLPQPEIKENSDANLTFFKPDGTWVYAENKVRSKSKNSPFIGMELTGKVFGTVHKGQFTRNEA
ncbi:dihydroorotase [Adhaeribacter sp. BT258]|uniref:Dihydroorotase n=1 Tax=Adhaeribacter terrigena TaxID=2793070 RepID=A0ABS1BYC4_9BACT|nr:dihydroorotase [Adhaeribacter terrigena]MBK0402146.1 dihydroorotase [Adhaeribacter terrigena]